VSSFGDDRAAEMRELFFETAQELMQALNEGALKLEKTPGDLETVRAIRRTVHTLKGDAAAVGFPELSELAHELEDALAVEAGVTPAALAEVAFAAADTFGAMLTCYRDGSKLPSSEALHKIVRKLASDPKTVKTRKTRAPSSRNAGFAWTEYEKLAVQNALNQGKQVYQIAVQVDPNCAMPIAARQLVLNSLGECGEVLATRPDAASAQNTMRLLLLLATEQTAEQIEAKCRIPTIVSDAKVEPAGAPTPKIAPVDGNDRSKDITAPNEAEAQAPSETSVSAEPVNVASARMTPPEPEPSVRPIAAVAENLLRVDADRIDAVLNLVGELIIGKSMLQEALNEFAVTHPKEVMRGRFADAMAFQSRVLNDLQRAVMKVRMVPVEQLFRRFPRMVRDVAKQCGKQVELVVSGQDTALDKSLLDAIAEPMTHLVRNSISHGIESVEERQRNGKLAQGTIRLDAYHQGNQVVVEVSDDGRGINTQKVKARAVERGLVNREEAERLSEADILELIFRPGFSTADQITEVAGRGVGLDVVQSVLHRLKGTVNVTSNEGKGSTFQLQLPLTLAIIKALLFRVENRLYAMPLNAVAEISRARECDIHQVDNCEVLQLRNRVLPLVRLGRRPDKVEGQAAGKVFILVIAMGERRLGLVVNALQGEEELVIKALDDRTGDTELVSGASILGDGQVVLILNLAAVIERFAKSRPDGSTGPGLGMLLSYAERASMAQSAAGGRP